MPADVGTIAGAEAQQQPQLDEPEDNESTWSRREAARLRQIAIGKARPEYRRYVAEVSRERRSSSQPHTPNPRTRVSKRQFDRELSAWRRQLHEWDTGAKLPSSSGNELADAQGDASSPWSKCTSTTAGWDLGDLASPGESPVKTPTHVRGPNSLAQSSPAARHAQDDAGVVQLRLADGLLPATSASPTGLWLPGCVMEHSPQSQPWSPLSTTSMNLVTPGTRRHHPVFGLHQQPVPEGDETPDYKPVQSNFVPQSMCEPGQAKLMPPPSTSPWMCSGDIRFGPAVSPEQGLEGVSPFSIMVTPPQLSQQQIYPQQQPQPQVQQPRLQVPASPGQSGSHLRSLPMFGSPGASVIGARSSTPPPQPSPVHKGRGSSPPRTPPSKRAGHPGSATRAWPAAAWAQSPPPSVVKTPKPGFWIGETPSPRRLHHQFTDMPLVQPPAPLPAIPVQPQPLQMDFYGASWGAMVPTDWPNSMQGMSM